MPLAAACAVCTVTPLALVSWPLPLAQTPAPPHHSDAAPPVKHAAGKPGIGEATVGGMIPQRDRFDWPLIEHLFGGTRQAPPGFNRREERERPPARKAAPPAAYRTLCVRLCDGYYWPISYSTSRIRAKRDAERCEQSCPGRARLFLHRNPGEEVEDMVDLQGRRYRDHPQAFLYRAEYIAGCTCRSHPWEAAALARHRSYMEAARTKMSVAPTGNAPRTRR
jgi:hypothetical protein